MRSSARENLLDPVQLFARPAITLSAKPPLCLGHQLPLQNVPEGLRCLTAVPLFLTLACSFVAFGRKNSATRLCLRPHGDAQDILLQAGGEANQLHHLAQWQRVARGVYAPVAAGVRFGPAKYRHKASKILQSSEGLLATDQRLRARRFENWPVGALGRANRA